MTTQIVSNGSKWAGELPDSIPELLKVLETEPLDRRFEAYGNFYNPAPQFCDHYGNHNHGSEHEGLSGFWGNFFTCSHVFNIYTNDPELIRTLRAAIEANQQRSDYLGQDKPVDQHHPLTDGCNCVSCSYERARKTCPICNKEVNQ